MNNICKVVWSQVHQALVVVSEIVSSATRTHSRRQGDGCAGSTQTPHHTLHAVALACSACLPMGWTQHAQAQVLPKGGQVVAGQGQLQTSGSVMTVTQTSHKMAVDWQSFNIGQGSTVHFVQPSSTSVALNRVLGTDVSVIQGALKANGQVFLVNPNGVLFSKDAQVHVGGIVASTLSLSTADAGGTVALIAAKISNTGQIKAERGNVLMGAGSKVKLDLGGPVKLEVEQGAIDALIEQGGGIRADGGLVYLTAKAVGQLTTTVINHTGVTEARTLATGEKGQIFLMGGMDKERIVVGGKLDASAPLGGDGGFIETSAANVRIQDDARVSTLAASGRTGTWLIDPTDFTVSSGSASQTASEIGATTLANNLNSTDMALTSSGEIHVNADVTWSTNKLTLEASGNININANLNAHNNASLDMKAGYSTPGSAGGSYDNTKSVLVGMDAATGLFKGKVSFFSDAGTTARSGTGFLSINGQGYSVITQLLTPSVSPDIEVRDGANTLQGFGHASMNSGKYALGADIDAASTKDWNKDTANIAAGFTPIQFTGIFDGLGHTVSDLYINRPATTMVGLFSLTTGATVRNVGVVSVDITGSGETGGLVGRNRATIRNSYSTGTVRGGAKVGGLVGWNLDYSSNYAAIIGSHSDATVMGTSWVGGLAGANWAFATGKGIVNSYATGAVTASSDHVGGLVGYSGPSDYGTWGVVTNSFYNIDADPSFAKKIGTTAIPVTPYGLYGNQYTDWVNGGRAPLSISNYSTSLVPSGVANKYTIGTPGGLKNMLGFADQGQYTFTLTADIDLSARPGFYVPILKAHFDGAGHTISNLNLNFKNSVLGMFGGVWGSVSNLGLVNVNVNGQDYIGGLAGFNHSVASISNSSVSGTATITGREMVGGLVGASEGAITGSHAAATVTASGTGFYGIGGLVGQAWDGTISNSYSTGTVNTTSANYMVGGLVGFNYATITNSYSEVNVTAPSSEEVGGLVGFSLAPISGSYAKGQVTALSGIDVGGLVGYTNSTISDSFATGAVSGGSYVGGLVGYAHSGALIEKSYSTGAVAGTGTSVGGFLGAKHASSTLSKNFYDTETSGKAVGAGNASDATGVVEGKTTAQMKDIATYVGWDIAADTAYTGTFLYPRLSMTGTTPVWLIGSSGTGQQTLTYTLGNVSQTYAGTSYSLSDYWTSSAIFGAPGSGLLAGTDYVFNYNGSTVTGFSSVGTYSGIGIALTTAGAANYALATTGNTNGTWTINPAALTITANSARKTYDGSPFSGGNGVSISGLVGGETSAVLAGTLSYTGSSQGAKNAGNYTITPQGLSSGNYAISYVDGTLTVDKAPVTVTADNQRKVYGSADPALTYQVTSGALLSGDSLSGALTRTAGNNVGSYTIDASGLANGNYQVTARNGTLTISPRPITVTADDLSKVYGYADPALTYQVTSGALVAGDSLSGALTRTAGNDVGSYTIDASALANDNYQITAINGLLTIKPSSAGAIAAVQAQAVGASTPPGASSASGPSSSVAQFPEGATVAINATTGNVISTVQSGGLLLQSQAEPADTSDSNNEADNRRKASARPQVVDAGRDPAGFMRVFVVRGGVNTNFAQIMSSR